jgi:DNA-binding NarL/FixJ family response regulator
MSIRILIADDQQIMRQALRALLEKEPGMEVVAEAEDGRKVLALVRELLPQVLITEIAIPDLNGIEVARQVHSDYPEVKIIALSRHSDHRYVVNMLQAGAHGYLLKNCTMEELTQAIRLVMADNSYLSPPVADILVKDFVRRIADPTPNAFTILTVREREVLQMMTEGRGTSQIAELLSISGKTVETHRQQVMHKLNMRSIAQLTKYAIREGLTSLDN